MNSKKIEGSLDRNLRQIVVGKVVSNKMDKTVKVQIQRKVRHHRYDKIVSVRSAAVAHNEIENVNVGDSVKIMSCRPLSKTKRWVVVSKVSA